MIPCNSGCVDLWFVIWFTIWYPAANYIATGFFLTNGPLAVLQYQTNPSNTRLSRWLLPKRQLAWVSDDVRVGKGRGWDCNETEHTPPCKLGSGSKRSTLMVSLVQPCHTERNKRNSCQAGLFHNIHICSYYEQCQHPTPRKVANMC